MKTSRSTKGRGLFYTRDSGGRHETTPARYVEEAKRKAESLGVTFTPTVEDIEQMQKDRLTELGDAFFDHDVCGNTTSRTALDALFRGVTQDLSISHVFIPRRDRLSRPNDPQDAINLENCLRKMGVTIVFDTGIVKPLPIGARPDIADALVQLVHYDQAGEFRRQLSEKMIHSQVSRARKGHSTGGRPPYGFRRYQVNPATNERTLMSDGHRTPRGYHVIWLPGPKEELQIIRRIVKMLAVMPASRVAAQLTEERIPAPDTGRTRTDGGIKHEVSGRWNPNTVVGILKNPLLRGETQYGRRLMGDQSRMTRQGPRQLTEDDVDENRKPRVVRNDPANIICADAGFEPIVDVELLEQAQRAHAERGRNHIGAARHLKGKDNPLSGKVFCMNCGAPMYRCQQKRTYRYRCSGYETSRGKLCNHNHVNGPTAAQFALNSVGQLVQMQGLQQELRGHLVELARQEMSCTNSAPTAPLKTRLQELEADKQQIEDNLCRATSDASFKALEVRLDEISGEITSVEDQLATLAVEQPRIQDIDEEVERALGGLSDLEVRLRGTGAGNDLMDIFTTLNLRMYFNFGQVPYYQKTRCQVTGGVITIGDIPPPVEIYPSVGSGHHRTKRKKARCRKRAEDERNVPKTPEQGVLGKNSRGD